MRSKVLTHVGNKSPSPGKGRAIAGGNNGLAKDKSLLARLQTDNVVSRGLVPQRIHQPTIDRTSARTTAAKLLTLQKNTATG